jgi:hypothetical protein
VETMMEYQPILRCCRKRSRTTPVRTNNSQMGTIRKKSILPSYKTMAQNGQKKDM